MKKTVLVFLLAAMFSTFCFGTINVLAQEVETEPKEYNLIDFDNSDFGEHSFDAETGTLTLVGNDTVNYMSTLFDKLTDDQLVLADGTKKNISELTIVTWATFSAKSNAGWQVPYAVVAKNDEASIQYHFRNTLNNQYIFRRDASEQIISEVGVGYVADGTPYQMLIKKTGTTFFAQTIALPLANGATITLSDADMEPCLGIGARGVAGSTVSDMKMYVAESQENSNTYVQLGAYAKNIEVKSAPATVEQGNDLSGCTFTLNMLDGTTKDLSLQDVTITGFDKNTLGEQKVTVQATVLNSVLTTEFTVTVTEPVIRTNVADFGAADYGRNYYDAETGTVILYGNDSMVDIPTIFDGITDGKVILSDGTEKDISELTIVSSMTIKPGSIGGWTVPFFAFALIPNGELDSHVRVNMGGAGTPAYVMCRYTDAGGVFHEDVIGEIAAEHYEEGVVYTVTVELTGKHVKYMLDIGGKVYTIEFDITHEQAQEMQPCLKFGDRTNADSEISNMQYYVKGVELGAYAKSISVKSVPDSVEQGEDLANCTFTLNMLDGTTQDVTLDDVTIAGFDKNTAGTQTVTVSKQVLNSTVSTTFEVEVKAAETSDPEVPGGDTQDEIAEYKLSLSKTTYQQGEEFDLSTVSVKAVYESGKEEPVEVTASQLTISGYDKDKAGEQTVKITYQDKEYSFTVTVAEKEAPAEGGCAGAITGITSLVAAGAVCSLTVLFLKKKARVNK